MISDLHVHVGDWTDRRFEPVATVRQLLKREGIGFVGVSSTTACSHPYSLKKVLMEGSELLAAFPGQVFHWLWIHPDHIPRSLSGLTAKIHGLKLHPYEHDWHSNPKLLPQAFELARQHCVPILMHTGGRAECSAGRFADILTRFPSVRVILAHARPMDEAIEVSRKCPNAWFDTAFVSAESLAKADLADILNRFVFGSDYPIDGILQNKTYTAIRSAFPSQSLEQVDSATRRFLGETLWRPIVDAITERFHKWHQAKAGWRLPGCPADHRLPSFIRTGDLPETNAERMDSIAEQWHKEFCSAAGNDARRLRLAADFLSVWGGIRNNKLATIERYLPYVETCTVPCRFQGIASWSKLLFLADPSRFAIYDSRVARAMNRCLTEAGVHDWRFPVPPGRQSAQQADDESKGSPTLARTAAYGIYLDLITLAAEAVGRPLRDVEFALFASGAAATEQR